MNNLPQEWLRSGKTLEELTSTYAIDVKRHSKHPHLVMLKYNQIESPMGEPIVQQCRGLILNEKDNWNVVAWPFDKFFNYGEGHAAPIDWNTAKFQEKLDGSLIILYFHNGWQVSTSGMPDASGTVNGFDFTFEKLFWRVIQENGYALKVNPLFTYMFELMTPYNKIVVQHKENKLALLGIRSVSSGQEMDVESFADIGVPKVKHFQLKTIDDVLKVANELNPVEQEGFVVIDDKFNRIKVKSPSYVALHQLKGSLSPKRLLDIIRHNENEEFLTYFPEFKDEYHRIKTVYDGIVKELEERYAKVKDIQSQKDFALAIKDTKLTSALFSLRKGQVPSIKEWLANSIAVDKLAETIL